MIIYLNNVMVIYFIYNNYVLLYYFDFVFRGYFFLCFIDNGFRFFGYCFVLSKKNLKIY